MMDRRNKFDGMDMPSWRRWVGLGVLLAGLAWPAAARAVTPVATNNAVTLATGAAKYIYLYNSVTWTGATWTLTYTILSTPQRGTLTPYGYYAYYKADQPGYVGTDTFTWCAASGIETSGIATCTITITGNSAPVANPLSCSAPSGVTMTPVAYLSSYVTHAAADQGQTMSYMVVSPASHGAAYLDPSSGQFGYVDYVSAPGFVGTDTFTWAVSDGFVA